MPENTWNICLEHALYLGESLMACIFQGGIVVVALMFACQQGGEFVPRGRILWKMGEFGEKLHECTFSWWACIGGAFQREFCTQEVFWAFLLLFWFSHVKWPCSLLLISFLSLGWASFLLSSYFIPFLAIFEECVGQCTHQWGDWATKGGSLPLWWVIDNTVP